MQLPAPFSKLEPFVDQWALGTERERNHARLTSTMEEIQEFYDAMLSQINEALAHLDRFPLGDMPEAWILGGVIVSPPHRRLGIAHELAHRLPHARLPDR